MDQPEIESQHWMVCACGGEFLAEADALRKRVKAALRATDANLISKIVYALQFLPVDADGEPGGEDGPPLTAVNFRRIDSDMWAGVEAEAMRYVEAASDDESGDWVPVYRTWVEADRVEDAFCKTWEVMTEKFAKKPANSPFTPSDVSE
jgi:hypothetical protein